MRSVSVDHADRHADLLVQILERLRRLEGSVSGIRSGKNPSVKARHSATQAMTTAVTLTLTWTATEDYDTDGFHDTSTNPSRLTVPDGLAGLYLVGYSITVAASTGLVEAWVTKNGAGSYAPAQGPAGSGGVVRSTSDIVPLAVGDYVQANARQSSGGASTAWSSIDSFWMTRIGSWL